MNEVEGQAMNLMATKLKPKTVEETAAALAAEWRIAKNMEDAAKKKRVEIEAQIAEAFPPTDVECIRKFDDAGVKISVSYGVTRSVDTPKLQGEWANLTAFAQDAFRWKADVSVAVLRNLEENHPALYKQVAAFITTKSSKPSVKVEV
jgi:hypothetical protein